MIQNDYYWIIYVVSASGWVESTQQNQNVMLGLDEPPSVWCWQPVSRVTVDANGRITILCFLCSIGAASFFHNHAPEPLPAMHRCIHPASCVRVCQGRVTSTMNFSYASFKSWRSTEYILYIQYRCATFCVWNCFQCSINTRRDWQHSQKTTKIIFLNVFYVEVSFVFEFRGFSDKPTHLHNKFNLPHMLAATWCHRLLLEVCQGFPLSKYIFVFKCTCYVCRTSY